MLSVIILQIGFTKSSMNNMVSLDLQVQITKLDEQSQNLVRKMTAEYRCGKGKLKPEHLFMHHIVKFL